MKEKNVERIKGRVS